LVAGAAHSSVICEPTEDAWTFPWNIFQPGHPAYGHYTVHFDVFMESYLIDATFRSNPNCKITNNGHEASCEFDFSFWYRRGRDAGYISSEPPPHG